MEIAMSFVGINDLTRMWDGWKDFIKYLSIGHNLYFLGTKEEGCYYDENIGVVNDNIIKLFGLTSIKVALEIIHNADAFIGSETGLSHYANYIKKDSLIIFVRPNDIIRAGHFNNSKMKVLYNPTIDEAIDNFNKFILC